MEKTIKYIDEEGLKEIFRIIKKKLYRKTIMKSPKVFQS